MPYRISLLRAFALILAIGAGTVPAVAAQDQTPSPVPARNMPAEDSPMVGGAPMYPSRTIIENASSSKDHTTLVAAVKAAGLEDTLEGPGPFTVFAPTDEAFAKLPNGTVASLVKPQNRATLVKLLTYHVVAGKMTASRIRSAIKAGGGTATLTTVEGEPLTASLYDDRIILTDAKGGTATITIDNVMQSNGLIHVVDTVLMP